MHETAQALLLKLPYDELAYTYAGMALDRLSRTQEAYDLFLAFGFGGEVASI